MDLQNGIKHLEQLAHGLAQSQPIVRRLADVLLRALPMMPEDTAREVVALMSPQNLAIFGAVFVCWATSFAFGVGELATTIVLVASVPLWGWAAFEAARHLLRAAQLIYKPRNDADLDEAARELTAAIVPLGVATVLRPLGAAGSLKAGRLLRKASEPAFYQPTVNYRSLQPGPQKGTPAGSNKYWFWGQNDGMSGDILLDTCLRPKYLKKSGYLRWQHRTTSRHEQAHSFLTAKFRVGRNLRNRVRVAGYNHSHVLCYLEETIAQTYGLMAYRSFPKSLVAGMRFPLANGYVSLVRMGAEVSLPMGLLLLRGSAPPFANPGWQAPAVPNAHNDEAFAVTWEPARRVPQGEGIVLVHEP